MDEDNNPSAKQLILDKLMAYGDSLLDDERKSHRKRNKTKERSRSSGGTENNTTPDPCVSKKSKKKKRKISDNKDTNDNKNNEKNNQYRDRKNISSKEKLLLSFKTELGILDQDCKPNSTEHGVEFVSTTTHNTGSKENNRKRHPTEVTVVEFPQRNKKKGKVSEGTSEISEAGLGMMDLNNARHEVEMFGISGMKNKHRREAMEAYLVRLGAKPRKMKKKKINPSAEANRVRMIKKQKTKVSKRDKDDLISGFVDGQKAMGSFKNGVLRINKDMLKKPSSK